VLDNRFKKVKKPCLMAIRKKVVVGAYVGKAVCDKLDALASKLDVSRSEAAGVILEAVLNKPGFAEEFVRLEQEKNSV
jgi:hypothetical protein